MVFLANVTYVYHSANAVTCVGGGALSITGLPGSVDFSAQNTSLTNTTTGATFGSSVLFEDMRNVSANFTLTLTATDYADTAGTSNTFSLTNLEITSDDNDTVGLIDCDAPTGITLNAINFSVFSDSDSNGTSDSKTLISGDTRARIGKYAVEPELQITIPARTTVGTYRTTLTFSIQ